MLCTGTVPEKDAEQHPLIRFKLHAMATNEIFLLVGAVVVAPGAADSPGVRGAVRVGGGG